MYIQIRVDDWKFQKYLYACETLQIDPSREYAAEFISKRAALVLDSFKVEAIRNMKLKQLSPEAQAEYKENVAVNSEVKELLDWFVEANNEKYYFLKEYSDKCKKLIQKNKLVLLAGTVNAQYKKRSLSQDNYYLYKQKAAKKISKIILLVFSIASAVLFIGGIATVLILNALK